MDAKWNRDITSDLIIDFRVRGLWTWSWCKHSRNPCVEAVWRDYDASNRVFSITRVGLFFVATQNTSSSITHITIKQLSRPAISLFHYTELSNVCKQFQSNRLCLRVCVIYDSINWSIPSRHCQHGFVKRCESFNFKCVKKLDKPRPIDYIEILDESLLKPKCSLSLQKRSQTFFQIDLLFWAFPVRPAIVNLITIWIM